MDETNRSKIHELGGTRGLVKLLQGNADTLVTHTESAAALEAASLPLHGVCADFLAYEDFFSRTLSRFVPETVVKKCLLSVCRSLRFYASTE